VSRIGRSKFDVVVVGAGVVGCAIARALARRPLRVALVDAEEDVCCGTSKANTAILHTGFDATPGSVESALVSRGFGLLGGYAARAGIPVERVGALLVAWDEDELDALPSLAAKAQANGYAHTSLVGIDELRRLEPNLGAGALGALAIPDESIICPWTTTLAYATEAVQGGVELLLGTRVTGVSSTGHDGLHELETSRGPLTATWLVNAAGLLADELDHALGYRDFTVTPRRGELIVFDKLARTLVSHVLLPIPTSRGKGVLVAPTVYGNVLLGPTAEDLDDKTATGSTERGLAFLRERGARIVPALLEEEVTAVYAGLRAATDSSDYRIRVEADARYVCVGGIRSTGLTASLAIAEHVLDLLADSGLTLGEQEASEPPTLPTIGEAAQRAYQRADLIAADPDYGRMVCHCERVTRGELRDALTAVVPARTLEGLRRRTRVQMGRCQGFYCGAEVRAVLEDFRRGVDA
jgi:glycerol-3-phosphate dehydrogenase